MIGDDGPLILWKREQTLFTFPLWGGGFTSPLPSKRDKYMISSLFAADDLNDTQNLRGFLPFMPLP